MSPFQVTEEAGTLRIAWSNRTARRDRATIRFMLFFLLIWPLMTAAVSGVSLGVLLPETPIAVRISAAVWSILGWLATLLLTHGLLLLRASESAEVSVGAVNLNTMGFLLSKTRNYPVDKIEEIALEWYCNVDGGHQDTVTLAVVRKATFWVQRRAFVGYWLANDLKQQLFETIRAFVEGKGIPLKMVVHGTPPVHTSQSAPNERATT